MNLCNFTRSRFGTLSLSKRATNSQQSSCGQRTFRRRNGPTAVARSVLVVATVSAVLLALSPAFVSAAPAPLSIIQPADAVAQSSKSYGEWSAVWWQTMLALSNDDNPILDTTGGDCVNGDAPQIFFLAGAARAKPVIRHCTVPAGKPLFFPILNTECSTVESPPFFGRNDAQLTKCAKILVDGVNINSLKGTLDGVSVPNLAGYRVASPVYTFTMRATNNFLGLDGVTGGRSAADGYYLLLARPAPGDHTIHFEGAFDSGPGAGFSLSVTYHLTAQ
jgi:hypothetical protein